MASYDNRIVAQCSEALPKKIHILALSEVSASNLGEAVLRILHNGGNGLQSVLCSGVPAL